MTNYNLIRWGFGMTLEGILRTLDACAAGSQMEGKKSLLSSDKMVPADAFT